MMCKKCETTLAYGAGWRLWNTRSGGFKSFLFCSLDCLSRWVDAQRLIAPVEERCVCCRGIRPCATLTKDNGPCCFECICQ